MNTPAVVLVHGAWHGAWCWQRVVPRLRQASLPRTFIDCTSPALPTIAVMRQRVRTESGWEVRELTTGHDPMVSEPQALSNLLIDVARRYPG